MRLHLLARMHLHQPDSLFPEFDSPPSLILLMISSEYFVATQELTTANIARNLPP